MMIETFCSSEFCFNEFPQHDAVNTPAKFSKTFLTEQGVFKESIIFVLF
jgi:hypothetical protein